MINKMHLHGNSRHKAAHERLWRQVYTMTTYITCWFEVRVGVVGGCHLPRGCGQLQLVLSPAGYRE